MSRPFSYLSPSVKLFSILRVIDYRGWTVSFHIRNEFTNAEPVGGFMDTPKLQAEWEGFKGYISMTWDKVSDEELVRVEGNLASVIGLIEEKYKEPKEQIEARIKELFQTYLDKKEQLKTGLSDLKENIGEQSAKILHGIKDKSAQYSESAKKQMDKIKKDNIEPAVEASEEYIKLHPFTAVIGALGAGLLIGGIVGLLISRD
jgi:ElaB/YqjD/DUF883 family membrane-anchored ribosome-binding protein